jgi:hypothetical protein
MTAIQPPAPAPVDPWNLSLAEFSSQVLEAKGKINVQYGLGTLNGAAAQRDLTGDGQPEFIYTFSSGQTLIAVSNYGETKTTYEDKTEMITRGTGRYKTETKYRTYTVREKTGTRSVENQDCTEHDAAEQYNEELKYWDGGDPLPPGAGIRRNQKPPKPKTVPPCKTWTTQEDVYEDVEKTKSYTEQVEITETVPVTKQVPVSKPVMDFGDVDADGNRREKTIGKIVQHDDPNTRDIETYDVPVYTLVLEQKAPPPPPPPLPEPKVVKKSSALPTELKKN